MRCTPPWASGSQAFMRSSRGSLSSSWQGRCWRQWCITYSCGITGRCTRNLREIEVLYDCGGGSRFVQRVEMKARSPLVQQLLGLSRGVLDAELDHRLIVGATAVQLVHKRPR